MLWYGFWISSILSHNTSGDDDDDGGGDTSRHTLMRLFKQFIYIFSIHESFANMGKGREREREKKTKRRRSRSRE